MRRQSLTKYFTFTIQLLLICINGQAQSLSSYTPKHGSFTSQTSVLIEWNSLATATDYTVNLSQDPTFATGVLSSPSLVITNWTTSPLSYGTWYWRISANTPSGPTESAIRSFTVYSPDQNPNLSFWIHAGVGLTIDGGGQVQSCLDNSSNNYLLAQSDSLKRPTVNPSSLNGHPALSFDGTEFLNGGDILDIGTANRGMLVVGKMGSGDEAFISKSLYGVASSRYSLVKIGGEAYYLYVDNADRNIHQAFSNTNHVLYTSETNRTSSTNKLTINQTVLGTSSISNSYNMNSPYRFLVGAYNDANDVGQLLHLNGEISEIIFIDFINASEVENAKYYLRDKYNAPLDLGPDIVVSDRFCDTSLTATSGYTNLLWSTGETTATIAVNEGTYWVQGTDLFGYTHYDTIEVRYPQIPEPPTTGICSGGNVIWEADMGPGYTYLWSTTETTSAISISSAGGYSVDVFDSYGCSRNSGVHNFTIDNYSQTAYLGNDTTLCAGNLIALQIGAPETVSYLWPDASTASTYAVDTTGLYWVESTNINGCVAQDTIYITISGTAPVAMFTTADICLGNTAVFTDASSSDVSDPIVLWGWDFGDGNNDNSQNTSNVYSASGAYEVELYIETQNGCGAYHWDTIQVNDLPHASFNSSGVCSADSVFFTDQSTAGDGLLNQWSWDFGQPSSGTNTSLLQDPAHLYDEVNNFDVYLLVTDDNGCTDDTTTTIAVNPSPQALFTALDGCLDQPLGLTNSSQVSAPDFIVSYQWDFGDGTTSSSSNPSKLYAAFGNYNMSLVVTTNSTCTDTLTDQVTIYAMPVPNFTAGNACVGTYTEFTDVSNVPNGSIDSTRWIIDVSDTLYGSPGYFVFDTEGEHFIKLTTISADGCQRDTIKMVTVGPELSASFTTLNGGAIIAGSPVDFQNNTIGGDSYVWDLGDMSASTDIAPVHIYSEALLDSLITVELIANNTFGCSDTTSLDFMISRAELDLFVQKLFLQEINGYYNVAVKLHNNGTARIESVDLELVLQNGTSLLEQYTDTLNSGQTDTYILSSHPSAVFSDQDGTDGYICITGTPYTTPMIQETDLTNNDICENAEGENPILIGPVPNPATDQIELGVLLSQEGTIDLAVYDERGRLVEFIYDGQTMDAGYYVSILDVSTYEGALYLIRMVTDEQVVVKKLVKK